MSTLLSPPIAFLLYLAFVLAILLFGKQLAGAAKPSELKSSVYHSGEESPRAVAAPGYRPFFLIAFFFAILHLGVLVLGSGGFNLVTGAYAAGLALALLALILG